MTFPDDNETVQIVPDPDKLFVYHRQQLSAMLDGELSPDQAKFMLRRLQHDGELAACWERWQVCGDVLRGQRNDLLPADFAQRVATAIGGDAGQAEAPQVRRAPRPRLARWGGGAAVAASVALMAVFVGRQLPEVESGYPAEALPALAGPAVPAATAPASGVELAVADAEVAPPAAAPDRALRAAPVAPAVAAVAVAAAEAPRRATQRRTVAATPAAQAQAPASAPPPEPQGPLPDTLEAPAYAFAMPEAVARPWPRSLLAPQGGLAVSSGGLLPPEPSFEPLLPGARWPAGADAPQVDAAQP